MLEKYRKNERVERYKDTPFRQIFDIPWKNGKELNIPEREPISSILSGKSLMIQMLNGKVVERWIDDRLFPESMLVKAEGEQLKIKLIDGAKIDHPIVIHHNSYANEPAHFMPEIIIEAEAKSKADILYVETGEGEYFITPKVTMNVAKESEISWISVSINHEKSYSLFELDCDQHEKSLFHLISYQSRGKIVRSDVRLQIVGEDAYTRLDGLNIGKDHQHLAHVVDMRHSVPNCLSEQQIKNIIKDEAMALFDGEIHVYRDAQKINADQMTRSLLLNDGARTLTIPRLEIYADDVRCTHGATVGFIEQELMFYLQSRGLSEVNARKLLMRAYGAEIVDSIDNVAIKEWLLHILDQDIETLL